MNLFYNRDRNISLESTLTNFNFNPAYGSSISFSCKKNIINFHNYTFTSIPTTLNNIIADCSFVFIEDKNTSQKIMDFFESRSGTGAFTITDASNIYHPLTGYADDFSISMQNNNLYNINLKFSVERNSSILKWKSMSFVDHEFKEWKVGDSYKKYEPVYFETYSSNKSTNFFYATEDHTASVYNAPLNQNTLWTQNLFYENDYGLTVPTTPKVERTFFKNSFSERVKSQDNIHTFQNLQLNYANISDIKLKSLLHFLENSLGYKRFEFDLPQIYNKPKIFYVDSWRHTWKYKDCNELNIILVEDPLGIKVNYDEPSIIVEQLKEDTSITIDAKALDNENFAISFGRTRTGYYEYNDTYNWGNNEEKVTRFYRNLYNLTISDSLKAVSILDNVTLETGEFDITGNFSAINVKKIGKLTLTNSDIKNISFNNLLIEDVSIQANASTQLSFTNASGLKSIDFGNSSISTGVFNNCLKNVSDTLINNGSLTANEVSPIINDLIHINNLDYRSWSLNLKDYQIPFNPTSYFINAPNYYWFQSQESKLDYDSNWRTTAGTVYHLNQQLPVPKEQLFYPTNNTIGNRKTYNLKFSKLTGAAITDIYANYFACFCVAKYDYYSPQDQNIDQFLVGFDNSQVRGLKILNNRLYYADGSSDYLLASGLGPFQWFHFGMIRDNNTISGFVNGQLTNTLSIAADNRNYVDLSPGKTSDFTSPFKGNIADLLLIGNTSKINLDISKTGEFFSGYCGKYGIQAIPIL